MTAVSQVRSFSRPVQLLLVNQFAINFGFYMLIPYLAGHLTGSLGLAAWLVGLILGVRNFSQQGMFLVGGSLADRVGYKRVIMAGCGLRSVGFALFGLSDSLPALLAASVLTGLAGALFAPAVRAYVAGEAADRRVEAFSVFNVFYQGGILLGPLVGIGLSALSFQAVALTASAVFAALTILQALHLPESATARAQSSGVLAAWGEALANRPFLAFSVAVSVSYALAFQVYLGLPLEVRRITGNDAGILLLFSLPALMSIAGQVRITSACAARWSPIGSIVRGLGLMGSAFAVLLLAAWWWPVAPPLAGAWETAAAMVPVVVCVLALTAGGLMIFPFEMATIGELAGGRILGTYYGLHGLLSGVGILTGNLITGLALDRSSGSRAPVLPWLFLSLLAATSMVALRRVQATDALSTATPARLRPVRGGVTGATGNAPPVGGRPPV